MSTVCDSVSIIGLRTTHFRQLQVYLGDVEDAGWYYGNRKQFQARHSELKAWLDAIVEHVDQPDVVIPKKKVS